MTTPRYIVEAILFFVCVSAGKSGLGSLSNSFSVLKLKNDKAGIQTKDYIILNHSFFLTIFLICFLVQKASHLVRPT